MHFILFSQSGFIFSDKFIVAWINVFLSPFPWLLLLKNLKHLPSVFQFKPSKVICDFGGLVVGGGGSLGVLRGFGAGLLIFVQQFTSKTEEQPPLVSKSRHLVV